MQHLVSGGGLVESRTSVYLGHSKGEASTIAMLHLPEFEDGLDAQRHVCQVHHRGLWHAVHTQNPDERRGFYCVVLSVRHTLILVGLTAAVC